jgi:hypothetical protein
VATLLAVWVLVRGVPSRAAAPPAPLELPKHWLEDTQANFDKTIKPLVTGIAASSESSLYEGLPHHFWEEQLLQSELKTKKTVRIHAFPFYAERIHPKKEDAKKLVAICATTTSFTRYTGMKACGGFHPDWAIQCKVRGDVYLVLICFGCKEARLYGPKLVLYTDLHKMALKKLSALLQQYQKNRPAPKKIK